MPGYGPKRLNFYMSEIHQLECVSSVKEQVSNISKSTVSDA